MRVAARVVILVLALVAAFLGGMIVQIDEPTEVVVAQGDAEFPLLQEAVDYVGQVYVKDIPEQKAIEYALIRAYLSALGDSNTFFIEPAVAASESDALAGRYGGIGVELERNSAGDFVMYPFADSSALAAGIRDGDILLAINGNPVNLTSPMDEVRQLLRGEIADGNGVEVRVRNINETEERTYFIPFAEVLVPSVTWRTVFEAPEFGYVRIVRFTNRTPEEFAQAISELRAEGITALVLDLRGNSGGLLQESIQIADEFLDGGFISIEKRITGDNIKEANPSGIITDLPVVILVDSGTASASEIVAGALQDRERAILIGQQTFGKGSIQSILALSDSSSIHVTVALWYTPEGNALDGVGLTPDIAMIPDENGRDVELGEAIRVLREQQASE